jgi:prepilin-type N-terminal cleavage/methylation domain-containing protein
LIAKYCHDKDLTCGTFSAYISSEMKQMNNRAFTLIEILVAVTIIGAIVVFAFPTLAGSFGKQNVRSARDGFATMHGRARANAISRGLSTTFHFAGGDLYITAAHPVTGVLDTIGDVRNMANLHGVSLSANRDSLVFDSRGMGTETSSTLVIVSKGGNADSLLISQIGRIER